MSNEDQEWKEKLRALCEGLEIENIDKLMELGKVGDFRRLGERMSELIKSQLNAKKKPVHSLEAWVDGPSFLNEVEDIVWGEWWGSSRLYPTKEWAQEVFDSNKQFNKPSDKVIKVRVEWEDEGVVYPWEAGYEKWKENRLKAKKGKGRG